MPAPKHRRLLRQALGGVGVTESGRVGDSGVESDRVAESGLGLVGVCLVVDCGVLWV